MNYIIHNCHTHAFTINHIPKYYLFPFIPTTLLRQKWVADLGVIFAPKKFNKLRAFLYSVRKENHENVLRELIAYYPKNARFSVLSIDFDFMDAGKPYINFIGQIEELALATEKINNEYGFRKIIPFIGADPRRENILELIKEYIENRNFGGVKLYPGLGFFPDDERLTPIYQYCEEYEIPITTHCLPVNKNHFRHKISREMISKAQQVPGYNKKHSASKALFAQYLNHPYWYRKVLEKFPNLKINLAHFGGDSEWNKYLDEPHNLSWYRLIRDLLKEYPNVYADISYTVHDKSLYPLLKNVINSKYANPEIYSPADKILFGSDFYMLQKDYKERRFGIDLRGYLKDNDFWHIAETNPKKFLSNKINNTLL